MPRLSSPQNTSFTSRLDRGIRKTTRRCVKAMMKSHRFRIPTYDMPMRLRPWFLVLTSFIMILLAFLGFTEFAQSLPLNDRCVHKFPGPSPSLLNSYKILHFICLGVATGVFYFIWDVDEEARRIWIWRNAGLIFTGVVCFFFGGIVSEIVQSMLPYKTFQLGDIIANLSGSAVGLWVSFHLERYYRHRREISRLYRPLSTEEDELLSDSESEPETSGDAGRGLPLLPTHQTPKSPMNKNHSQGQIRLGDVWDEREELFEIGDDDDDENPPSRYNDTPRQSQAGGVKITVTSPSQLDL